MYIRRQIEKHLKRTGMTRYRLAVKAGIPHSTLLSIMSGKAGSPSLSTVVSIAKAFGLTVSELIGESSNYRELQVELDLLREENEQLREQVLKLKAAIKNLTEGW